MDPRKTRSYVTQPAKPIDFAKTQALRLFPVPARPANQALPQAVSARVSQQRTFEPARTQILPIEQVADALRSYKAGQISQSQRFAATQKLPRLAGRRRSRGPRALTLACLLCAGGIAGTLVAAQLLRSFSRAHAVAGRSRSLAIPASAAPSRRNPMRESAPVPALTAAISSRTKRPVAQPIAARASRPRLRGPAHKQADASNDASTASAAHRPAVVSQRMAADALASGDLARAAALYATLADRDPTDRALVEAARILKARFATGGAP